jgi:uncharacterized protein
MLMTKADIITRLGLGRHVAEGGYYRSAEMSDAVEGSDDGSRPLMDTILYLLTDDEPVGHFHRNQSEIVHFFHTGAPIEYVIIEPGGDISRYILGSDLSVGEQFQLRVPAGHWKASRLRTGEYGLVGEAVVPSFKESERDLISQADLSALFPNLPQEVVELAWGEV